MGEPISLPGSIVIDSKNYLLRIHKLTLQRLDNPKYIQIMVNPAAMRLAVRAVDQNVSGDQSQKVNLCRIDTGHSCEIYSRSFVKKLCCMVGPMTEGRTYRINGEVIPEKRVAVFSLEVLIQDNEVNL